MLWRTVGNLEREVEPIPPKPRSHTQDTIGMNLIKLCIPVLLALAACSGPQGKALHRLAPEVNSYRYSGLDRISPGDVLAIRFQSNPESWDQEVVVQADGNVSLKALDPMKVGGMLPSELDEALRSAYALVIEGGYPELTVTIAAQAPDQVYVIGQVGQPGAVQMGPDGTLTFVQAIALAGGHIQNTSWLGKTRLIRWDPASNSQLSWMIDGRTKWWGAAETIHLQEHDVLYVPNTRIDQAAINLDNWIRRMIPVPRILTN
ncbi:MAG: protein involved in polysaccharide export with SLBB domain [Planctomycetota bacterium]|jgi:protein involved in polysaccharide export with SLBB domain